MEKLTEEYQVALSELYVILNELGSKTLSKIPSQFMGFIKENKKQDYAPIYDATKGPLEQNFSKKAFSLLSIVYYNYLCSTEEEKSEFLDIFKK